MQDNGNDIHRISRQDRHIRKAMRENLPAYREYLLKLRQEGGVDDSHAKVDDVLKNVLKKV